MKTVNTNDCLNDLFDNVQIFNYIAGNFSFYDPKTNQIDKAKFFTQIKAQVKCVLEEAQETWDAINLENNPEGALDGVVDVLVTTYGLGQMLGLAGFNVDKACYVTADNNLTKFPTGEGAEEIVTKTLENADGDWVALEMQIDGQTVHVFKDENGKIRKPHGYVKNNLSDCVPDNFKEGFQ